MLLAALMLIASSLPQPAMPDAAYQAEIEKWREARETRLKADDGWLTVAGLFWLKHGVNTVGTDPEGDVVLPKNSAPARVGVFDFHDGITSFQAASGVSVTLN